MNAYIDPHKISFYEDSVSAKGARTVEIIIDGVHLYWDSVTYPPEHLDAVSAHIKNILGR